MPDSAEQHRREECRAEVLRYLSERGSLAFPAAAIRRKLQMDGDDFTDQEVIAACEFLSGFHPAPLLDPVRHTLGASRAWRITTAGIIAHERRP